MRLTTPRRLDSPTLIDVLRAGAAPSTMRHSQIGRFAPLLLTSLPLIKRCSWLYGGTQRQPNGWGRAGRDMPSRSQPRQNRGRAKQTPVVAIVMGSRSDWPTLKHAADTLKQLGIAHESLVMSAHRTPDRVARYAGDARQRGIKLILGRCRRSGSSTRRHRRTDTATGSRYPNGKRGAQRPRQLVVNGPDAKCIPVGTLAIGRAGAINAALLAAAVLALSDPQIAAALDQWRARQTDSVPQTPADKS